MGFAGVGDRRLVRAMTGLLFRFLPPILIGLLVWFAPPPDGVQLQAWRLLAIFLATIVGILAKTLPLGAMAMVGVVASMLTGVLKPNQALAGFGHPVVWLIVSAFFISRGFLVTGLGLRIAYLFMAAVGKKSLGLAYSMIGVDLVLAPAIPSNTARCGGVICPILRSVAVSFGSHPDGASARRLGAFLIKASYQGSVVVSGMFLTSMAGNPMAAGLAAGMGIEIDWTTWFLAALVPGLLSLAVGPWILYRIYPPEIKETAGAARMARQKLEEMGPLKSSEWTMLGTFALLLFLWIFGGRFGITSTVAALTGLAILLLTGTLRWRDILGEKGAWDALVWFAVLINLASHLNQMGLIPWFGDQLAAILGDGHWMPSFLLLSLVYFYSHYLFAGNTTHISSMYAPFLAVALAVGTPPLLAALVLGFFSNLFSGMTHYGTGPAPVFFGTGYVEMGDWWKLGGLLSVVNILIYFVAGGLWWKVLGIW